MNTADTLRLIRAEKWLKKGYYNVLDHPWLPELLLKFENYLLACEAERQTHG